MTIDEDDVILWPDGDWCFRYELSGMNHKSDDYETLEYDGEDWNNFFAKSQISCTNTEISFTKVPQGFSIINGDWEIVAEK